MQWLLGFDKDSVLNARKAGRQLPVQLVIASCMSSYSLAAPGLQPLRQKATVINAIVVPEFMTNTLLYLFIHIKYLNIRFYLPLFKSSPFFVQQTSAAYKAMEL